MTTQGPLFTGTGASFNDGGLTAWANPTNVQGDTTSTASTCGIGTNGGTSHRLRATNFGFSIPAGNTINGIMVEVEQSATGNNRHFWSSVKLLVAGTEVGTDQSDGSNITTTKAFKTFGSGSNLWGLTPTLAEVNASNFGVSFKIVRTGASATTSLYRCRITITYTSESSDTELVVSAISHAHAVENVVLGLPAEVVLSPSAFITASGDNTTARLTAPSPKTTGDFQAGRIVDDENPSDSINLTTGKYTEVAYSIKFSSGASGDYEFRLTDAGTPIDAYTQTPVVTVSDSVTLVVSSVNHVHTAESVALTQAFVLAVSDATHAHTAESVVLETGTLLVVSDVTHIHESENVALAQAYLLAVADATHLHDSETLALLQAYLLSVSDTTHVHTAANVTISPDVEGDVSLSVADAEHAHASETIALTQDYVLVVSDATHSHTSENVGLIPEYTLTVADGTHIHTAESVSLTQGYLLAVADATHLHASETVALVVFSILVVQDATHLHTVENIVFIPVTTPGTGTLEESYVYTAELNETEVSYGILDETYSYTAEMSEA